MIKAILHINELENENRSVNEEEFNLWQKIHHFIDGKEAIVVKENEDEYTLIGLTDPSEDREFHWLLGQDPELGSYIGDKEKFEVDWESGNYSFDSFAILGKNNVELIRGEGNEK